MPKQGLIAVRELGLPLTEPTSHREIPSVGWDHGGSYTSLGTMIALTQRENECSGLAVDGKRTEGGTLCTSFGGVRALRTRLAVLCAVWQPVAA